jgi:hypothetical protein
LLTENALKWGKTMARSIQFSMRKMENKNNTNRGDREKRLLHKKDARKATIRIFIIFLFLYILGLIDDLYENERYYSENPEALILPLVVFPLLVFLIIRWIFQRMLNKQHPINNEKK